MRSVSRVLVGLAVAAFCAAPVAAQMAGGSSGSKGGMAFGLAGGYYIPGGDLSDANQGAQEAGIGGTANFRYSIANNIWLTAGVGYSSHGIKNTSESTTLLTFAVEPRYTFAMSSPKLVPYVGARIQYGSASATVQSTDVKASGIGFGGTAGVQYTMSPSLALEGAFTFVSQSFGDVEAGGQTIPNSDSSGSIMALNFGVVFKFGR